MLPPNLQVGSRHPTDVYGVMSVTGLHAAIEGGWRRRDSIVIGEEEIGAVHVKELYGHVSALTQCGDRYVIGSDVAWLVRESGRRPPASLGDPVRRAQSVAGSSSNEKGASVRLEGTDFHTAAPRRRARP